MSAPSQTSTASFTNRLRDFLASDFSALDAVLEANLQSEVPLVGQISRYIIQAGGKRMRPALVFLASSACGYRGQDRANLAAIVELIHTATLLHDDVVDESSLRRGRQTANAAFGNAASVLVGDFLYSRAFQLMVQTGRLRVLDILANATNTIAEGEVQQLANAGNTDLTEAQYLGVIEAKTAKLFEAAARLGALIADAPPAIEQALADYGKHLGTAFQIADDVLDYTGDTALIGKNLGDDLAEGKLTLPVIRALAKADAADRAKLLAALKSKTDSGLADVIAAFDHSDALAYTHEAALEASNAAQRALAPVPDSPTKQLLLEFASFATERAS